MSITSIARRVPTLVLALIILVAGIAAGWINVERVRADVLAALVQKARQSAAIFENDELSAIAGRPEDVGTVAYERTKRLLQRLQTVDPVVRFVYIFRHDPATGKVIFLADSEVPESKDISLPGDVYDEAADSPGLQEVIAGADFATEGPLRDEFGTWVTGYSVIAQPTADGGKEILGVDLSAAAWSSDLAMAGAGAAGTVWAFFGLPFAVYLGTRRQRGQRAAIRNLSEAVDQAPSALLILDPDFQVEYANSRACQQIGLPRRDLVGRPLRELLVQANPPGVASEMQTAARSGLSWQGEWLDQRRDGSRFPVRGVVRPVKRQSGETVAFIAVFEDMTETKRTEAELRSAAEKAEAADRAKGRFLGTMSHEVRTPLNGIIGFTGLLQELDLSPEAREYIESIRASSEILLHLTSDILDFARIESGKLKLHPQSCDPRLCIEGVFDLMAGVAAQKGIELLHQVREGVPLEVLVDSARLRQVLGNLVNNAVKFTQQGEVEVALRVLDAGSTAGQEATLEFSVRDTGIGIPADQHHRLFRAFSQVDDSSTRQFGGTGLGLAICKTIVQLMGGDISLRSEPGRGSVFTFTIRVPVTKPAPVPPPHPLAGRRIGLQFAGGKLEQELTGVLQQAGAECVRIEAGHPADRIDAAVVDIHGAASDGTAIAVPALPIGRMIGLVSLALSSEIRQRQRPRFRALFNKPPHHGRIVELVREITAADPAPDLLPPPAHGTGVPSTPAAEASPPAPRRTAPRGPRVLLVEDNPVNQRLMQAMLDNVGCNWSLAENGLLALGRLGTEKFDLVLMDLHMPEMDGLTAIQKIRGGEAGALNREVKLIALTADARDEQRQKLAEAGANGYLTKPLKRAELQPVIDALRRG